MCFGKERDGFEYVLQKKTGCFEKRSHSPKYYNAISGVTTALVS